MTQAYAVLDDRFRALVTPVPPERLFSGTLWAEGPAWFPAHRTLVWSDIPNDRMLRWDETTGAVGTFRQPARHSNGNTVDREGRLVTCEHGGRRVTRTEHDGTITVLADRYDGRRLNSPNDVVVRSDGSVWFTDPAYGIDDDYEGHRAAPEQDGCHVYRVDPLGAVTRVADDFARPNGLAFSPDEGLLYVSDTGRTHDPAGPAHVRRLRVDGERLHDAGALADCTAGLFDGFRVDEAGRLWAGAGDGVHCLDPDGTLLGKIHLPEPVANVAWGGPKRDRLFICATTSLYAVRLRTRGA